MAVPRLKLAELIRGVPRPQMLFKGDPNLLNFYQSVLDYIDAKLRIFGTDSFYEYVTNVVNNYFTVVKPRYVCKIVSATEVTPGIPTWIYTVTELEKVGAGYGGWSVKSGGLTAVTAYNLNEDGNTASGLQNNGVNIDDLAGTGLTVQAVPVDTLVEIWLVTRTNATVEYWFELPNGVTGPCEAP